MNYATLRPRLIVVAGPNGSGKTSITEQLLRHASMGGCEYVRRYPCMLQGKPDA